MTALRNGLSVALLVAGVGLLSYWGSVTWNARAYQSRLAHRLENLNPSVEVAGATRREASTSGLVGRIEIPRLGVSAMIAEGITDKVLERGVGHVPSTPLPGERGNVGLAAHRDSYFHRLKDVAEGDRVRLSTPDGVFSYEVESVQVVTPDRVDLLGDTFGTALTLVTCYPFNFIGSAPKRFVVRCRPVTGSGDAQPVAAVVPEPSRNDEAMTVPIAAQAELPIEDGLNAIDPLPEAIPSEIQ